MLKIVPKDYGFNFNLPGKDFPAVGNLLAGVPGRLRALYDLDIVKMRTEFKPGIMIDLKPFPGTFAVGVDPNEPPAKAGPPIKDDKGRTSTLRPWKNGSNMDVNELQAGSTIYFPVFPKGGLIWTGDSHWRQSVARYAAHQHVSRSSREESKASWPVMVRARVRLQGDATIRPRQGICDGRAGRFADECPRSRRGTGFSALRFDA